MITSVSNPPYFIHICTNYPERQPQQIVTTRLETLTTTTPINNRFVQFTQQKN